jgi:hypothetical protein
MTVTPQSKPRCRPHSVRSPAAGPLLASTGGAAPPGTERRRRLHPPAKPIPWDQSIRTAVLNQLFFYLNVLKESEIRHDCLYAYYLLYKGTLNFTEENEPPQNLQYVLGPSVTVRKEEVPKFRVKWVDIKTANSKKPLRL